MDYSNKSELTSSNPDEVTIDGKALRVFFDARNSEKTRETISKARRAKGVTQEKMAEDLNYATTTIAKYEQGGGGSADMFFRIIGYVGATFVFPADNTSLEEPDIKEEDDA